MHASLFYCLYFVSFLAPVLSVVVETQYGPVRGHKVDVDNTYEHLTVDVFYGIPFAKDTSGPGRFRNPEPPDSWVDILEADTMGEACPQAGPLVWITHPNWDKFGEDCLHLNVYSPDVAEGGPYPVMVYIYGGAMQSGANIGYAGHLLASFGVVVVTINYRLGKFGFAFTGNDACPGNAGLWDQNMGLEFVANNIANFGGDPDQITVFGESAGAVSTSLQILSPHSKDMFHGAIMQSGSESMFVQIHLPDAEPELMIRGVADQLGCSQTDDYDMMDCMRDLTWENIYWNSTVPCKPGYICPGMLPVVDGPGGMLPQTPEELRAKGDIMRGPIISGINKDDGALFLPIVVPEALFGCCNRTYFEYLLRDRFIGTIEPRLTNVSAEDSYEALKFNYSPWPHLYDADTNLHYLTKIMTHIMFGVSWDIQIKSHQSVAPTYGYVYDNRNLKNTSALPPWMGTTHAAEVPYVFGYPLFSFNEAVRNDSLMYDAGRNFAQEDVEYSLFMMKMWTDFAKTGNPTPQPLSNPFGGTTVWPQFTWDEMNILLMGNPSITVEQEWDQKDYAFWREYMPYVFTDELRQAGLGIMHEIDDYPLYENMFNEILQLVIEDILAGNLDILEGLV